MIKLNVMKKFQLETKYQPAGDQKEAITDIVNHIKSGSKDVTLLGVTGSGKTFTMANVIAQLNRPTLVLSHNKTLAAQLFEEYREFFPNNAVRYFVSYYDYYQPESYLPGRDVYIEKEADINKEIEKYRLSAMNSVLRRNDVIVVSSVSCIYNIGAPDSYENIAETIMVGEDLPINDLAKSLVTMQYERGEYTYMPGSFNVKGDIVEVFPSYEDFEIRIEYFGDTVETISLVDPLTKKKFGQKEEITVYPAKNFVVEGDIIKNSLGQIRKDLDIRVKQLEGQKKQLEAQRLRERTEYDLEMLENVGYCGGIENYSRYFDGRDPGDPPYTLLDYFPKDYLLVIDESHMTIPQVRGMYGGDRTRKENLVNYGFRLPSALDNRPLNFPEFEKRMGTAVYTSATPADWEIERSNKRIVEQIIRPTGLIDPKVEIRTTKNQIDDVIEEVDNNIKKGQRVLITTLTKKMSEDLSNYLKEMGIKVTYLHSEIDTVERVEILRDLRLGEYDVVVGINLLREGIDVPEVSLVIILDADKEGFLRSETSLVQTMGRAARHIDGRVIMYGDQVTDSMKRAIKETDRRRKIQEKYNKEHNITPKSIEKDIRDSWRKEEKEQSDEDFKDLSRDDIKRTISSLEERMEFAAQTLEFEKAAELRDKIKDLRQMLK
jgi:excinuclease ABC subunit B